MNTYIMHFKPRKIPEKTKVGSIMERVEQYLSNPSRSYKCQEYGHHEDNCACIFVN